MENMSLVPSELPQKVVEGDGGSHSECDDIVFPYLAQAKVSGGVFTSHPRGFSLPHYAGCNKIGYVIQGTNGVAGLIYPESAEEKVGKLEKGDVIFVPSGGVSWWFNAGNDELKIIFLGEAHDATNPGTFTYCLVVGAVGVLKGFSAETISKAYDITKEQVNEFTNTQKDADITLIAKDKVIPKPSKNEHVTVNFEKISSNIQVKKRGFLDHIKK